MKAIHIFSSFFQLVGEENIVSNLWWCLLLCIGCAGWMNNVSFTNYTRFEKRCWMEDCWMEEQCNFSILTFFTLVDGKGGGGGNNGLIINVFFTIFSWVEWGGERLTKDGWYMLFSLFSQFSLV